MENKLTVKDSSISFLSTFILCQLGTLFFAVVGLIISEIFGISNQSFLQFLNTSIGCLLLSLVMDTIIISCFFIFTKNKNNNILSKPTLKKICSYILLALLCFVTLYPIVTIINGFIYKFFPQTNLTYPLTTGNYFISLISMVLLPAIAEELLFRGLIFKGLQKAGNTFAITISTLMFALFHLSLEQTIYPILMGFVFAVIMCYENNIIYCITVHLVNNFTTLTLQYFKISLAFSHWTYYLIATIAMLVFVTASVLIIKKLKLKNTATQNNSTALESTNNSNNKLSTEHKIYLWISLAIMIIIWLAVQLTTIF